MFVYRIVDKNDPSMYYLGSTKNMKARKRTHIKACETKDLKVYKYIRDNGGWDNFEFEIIEECDNYLEREKELIRELEPPLNMLLYNFDHKAWNKDWYEKNREKDIKRRKADYIKNREREVEFRKVHYQQNKEKIAEQNKVRVKCECGTTVRKCAIARHKKTDKHRLNHQNHQKSNM